MAVEKFLFDTSFDAPPPAPPVVVEIIEEPVPEEPPPPTFSEAEMEATRAQAYADGMAEGLRRARAEAAEDQTKRQNDLLETLSHTLATLLTEEAARITQSREMTMQIATAIARKLLPEFTTRHGLAEVEAAVLHVLGGLDNEPRLVVRVSEDNLDPVTVTVQQEAARHGFSGKLVFLADPAFGAADCRVEWADGGLERDTMRLWSEVDRLVGEVLRGNYAPKINQQTSDN